jgi:hypothetical protein
MMNDLKETCKEAFAFRKPGAASQAHFGRLLKDSFSPGIVALAAKAYIQNRPRQRSGKPLRHPKATGEESFSASC